MVAFLDPPLLVFSVVIFVGRIFLGWESYSVMVVESLEFLVTQPEPIGLVLPAEKIIIVFISLRIFIRLFYVKNVSSSPNF